MHPSATTRSANPSTCGEMPLPAVEPPPVEDNELSVDELRDAWPLLDLEERGDGLRVLPREDAEEFFIALPAHDQALGATGYRA